MEPVNEFVQTEPMIGLLEQYFMSEPPDIYISDSCNRCKKTWTSTPGIPTTTLLCGHTYHTVCQSVYLYNTDGGETCINETCDDYRSIVYNIVKEHTNTHIEKVDELLEENLKDKSFKESLKGMRASIRVVVANHRLLKNAYKNVKTQLIHKHIHTINQIQSELNRDIVNVRDGVEAKNYKHAIRSYRKIAASIFRKYHVSLRDVLDRKIIKMAWENRWVLERYRGGISKWRSSIRIYPGKKLWTDPIQDEV